MIKPGEHVLVGVSGGADSVCLLFLLGQIAKEFSLQVSVVHVNHQIRETARRDELFVQKLCEQLQIPCYVEHAAVEEMARTQGMTVEEAGRTARFDAFYQWKETLGADKIALAHHKDDQAETVLFHLCRGCGVDGLVGIRPVREDVIHPLLCVTRQEIEEFLAKEGLDYVTDETNAETVYSRNVLRHQVLPILEEKVCKESGEHIAMTASICLEASDFLSQETMSVYEQVVEPTGEGYCITDVLCKKHPYLQKSVIHQALALAAGSRKDLEQVHIEAVLALFKKQVGRKVDLPYGLVARRDYHSILIEKTISNTLEQKEQVEIGERKLSLPEEGMASFPLEDGRTLTVRVFSYDKTAIVPQKIYTKWFDYDRIDKCLKLRSRRTGDYFYMDETRRQTVKAYMINEKIPQKKRDQIPIIAEESQVLWMVGYRISSFYKVTEQTKKILEITIRGGTDNG